MLLPLVQVLLQVLKLQDLVHFLPLEANQQASAQPSLLIFAAGPPPEMYPGYHLVDNEELVEPRQLRFWLLMEVAISLDAAACIGRLSRQSYAWCTHTLIPLRPSAAATP